MEHFSVRDYGPTVARLLAGAALNELGPGSRAESRARDAGELDPRFAGGPSRRWWTATWRWPACAAIWLRFDFLEESHRISQSLDTPEGSFWHGVMHRREPDFFNAKYWFRRAGRTNATACWPKKRENWSPRNWRPPGGATRRTERVGSLVKAGLLGKEVRFLSEQASWDPLRFVDLCESALDSSPPLHTFCMRLQQLEWEIMFTYCYDAAAG